MNARKGMGIQVGTVSCSSRGPDDASRAYRVMAAEAWSSIFTFVGRENAFPEAPRGQILALSSLPHCADGGKITVPKVYMYFFGRASAEIGFLIAYLVGLKSVRLAVAKKTLGASCRSRRVCSLFVSFTLRRAICRRTITVASWGGESTLGEGQGSQDTARRTRSGRPYDTPARLASELCAGAHRSPSHPFPPPSVRVRDDGERPAVPVGAGRGAIGS